MSPLLNLLYSHAWQSVASLSIFLLLAVPAFGDDGVVEINQALALAGGVTAGDTPGFPVTISEPGSYRLTSNLDGREIPGIENVTFIHVTADDVVLDFNGFSVLGVTLCLNPGGGVICLNDGTGDGISASVVGFTVRNGTIRGAGGNGISCEALCVIENMKLIANGGDGVDASAARIERSLTYSNLNNGFQLTGMIVSSTSIGNGEHGIYDRSFASSPGSFIKNNSVRENWGTGIVSRGRVEDNIVDSSGTALSLNDALWGGNLISGFTSVTDSVQTEVNMCNGSPCP